MSIPSQPPIASIVTEGLKRGGRVAPSATQITDATEHQFREVKADIAQRSSRHPSLLIQSVIPTVVGQSRYSWPTAAEDIRSISLVYAPTETYWQSTAQAGGATSITLNASFSAATLDVQGKFVFLLGGTGANQVRQVVNYDNSTKVATVDTAWTTNPASGTTYHLGLWHRKLWEFDKPVSFDVLSAPFSLSTPCRAALVGREIWTDSAPDRIYALWIDHWANLDRLDDAGAMFLRHIQDYRSLWVQGVAVKTMQRYDEDRYQLELGVYQDMLNAYAGLSSAVGQAQFYDV